MPATVPLVHLGGWLTISFYILNYIFMFVAATDVGLNIVCVSGCVLGEGHRGSMDIKHKSTTLTAGDGSTFPAEADQI